MTRFATTLFKRTALAAVLAAAAAGASAAEFKIDPTHSFVTFEISHMGFSVLQGRFNKIEGDFSYDQAKPADSKIAVKVDVASVDTNYGERDKHLRDKYLDTSAYPQASFKSTKFTENGDKGTLDGELTLHGVTKPVSVALQFVGAGDDPWGGYRRGYVGTATIKRSDFGMTQNLGPQADSVALKFVIEGVRQ